MSDKNKTSAGNAEESDRSPQVGALLRASRLRVGEDLRDVSEDLCIRYLYLEAIEDCRYSDLPGDTYAIGFIRSYAEHLGLDGEEVVRRYRAEQVSGKRLSDLSFPTPVPDSGVPKGAIVLVGVVLAVLVYGGWYVTTTDDSILSELISPVPDRLQHLVDEDTNTDAPAGTSSSDATVDGQASSSSDADSSTRVSQETQEALDANTAEALAEATEAARESISTPAETTTDEGTAAAEQAADNSSSETPTPDTSSQTAETPQPPVEVDAAQPSGQSDQSAENPPTESSESAPTTSETSENAMENSGATPVQQPEETPSESVSGVAAEAATTPALPTNQSDAGIASNTENQAVSEAESEAASTSVVEESLTEVSSTTTENSVESNIVEESTPTRTSEPEVTAEDLNARSLQAATTSDAPEPEQNVASADSSSPAPQNTSAAASAEGIVIRAVESSWVQITDPASGEVVFTGLMNPGATFKVPARAGLLLDTGNAGAIDIIVNGNTVPKLGGVGSVRKGVALDRDRLIAGTATNG